MAMRALCSTGPLACLNLGAPTRPSVPRPPNGHSMALIFLPPTTPYTCFVFFLVYLISFVVFVEDLCIVASKRLFGRAGMSQHRRVPP